MSTSDQKATRPVPKNRPADKVTPVIGEAHLTRGCDCSCHGAIQPGLIPCPHCDPKPDLSSRSVAGEEAGQ